MKKIKIYIYKDPKSPIGEAYRTIRTNIQFSDIERNIKSIAVTSSIAEEGKTTTAINLAYSISQIDKKVILIDGDLRKPKIHRTFRLSNAFGLTAVLIENLDYKTCVQSIDGEKFDILTAGSIPTNPSELLGSKQMRLLLQRLKEDYDMVILDSPPARMVTDAAILSSIADGTIIVCTYGITEIDKIKAAKAALDKVNANILGVVMNKVPVKKGEYYSYK